MQIDLVPEIPLSGGVEKIVTVMDVFCWYLFAYFTSSQDAKPIAEIIFNIMTKHFHLPMTMIPDKGSDFMSKCLKFFEKPYNVQQKNMRKGFECLNERMSPSERP